MDLVELLREAARVLADGHCVRADGHCSRAAENARILAAGGVLFEVSAFHLVSGVVEWHVVGSSGSFCILNTGA